MSAIVFAGYNPLLVFFSRKPFSFIRSIDVRRLYSMKIINKYGDNVSADKTSSAMSKKYQFLHWICDPLFYFLYNIMIGVTILSGNHMLEVFAPSSVCVWNLKSKRNLKTTVCILDLWQALFQWSTDCQNLHWWASIPPKILLIYPMNFLSQFQVCKNLSGLQQLRSWA